jgi:pantoate--beta-alanine ligase
MYPDGHVEVVVDAPRLADRLCGAFRPGHFRGVLTVVAKLLDIVAPRVAVFGRKDFQQLALVRRMVADLDIDVEIMGGPIVRESDGLALSSRNVFLSPDERKQATLLSRGLDDARTAFEAGETSAAALVRTVRDRLDTGPLVRPQYIEVVSARDMEPIETADRDCVLAIAAHVGATRLIDNIELGREA